MGDEGRSQGRLPPAAGRDTETETIAEPCPSLRVVEAEWECDADDDRVRCGDNVAMVAVVRGPGSSDGVGVAFTVKHRHGNEEIDSADDDTREHRARAVWLSQKQCAVWETPEVFFTARAGGDSRDSGNLSFHRYRDSTENDIPSEGLDNQLVDVSFTGGEFILKVDIYIIPRADSRPDSDVAQSSDQIAAINAAHGPAEAASELYSEQMSWASDMQGRIEDVFRDRWVLHRGDCQRGASCDCPATYHCCKFPLKVQVRLRSYRELRGGAIDLTRPWNNMPEHVVNVWPNDGRDSTYDWYTGYAGADFCDEHRPFAHADCPACRNIHRDRQAQVLAHEVGHYLGFYDEYPSAEGGRTNPDARPGQQDKWSTDARGNLMGLSADGGSVGDALPMYYFEPFRAFFSQRMGEHFVLIPGRRGGT